MKISYNWLKQFVNTDWDSQRTSELLTDLGLEVEGIQTFETIKGGLKGVVVGHVLSCEKHENADKLQVTLVDIGAKEPIQIVCGAANIAKGLKVPVATVGTTLYDKEEAPWAIKKGKIRGVESLGMICGEDELGLGTDQTGIMVLDEALIPGTNCATIFEVTSDEIFEIGLTPNRADAMSHFGVARDLKAGLKQQNINKELITPSTSTFNIDNRSLKIDVDVLNNELAPRYCGITLSGITVKLSPLWLQNRLQSIGVTPKNNIVDATNYVLHELGQPLHAFDADKIEGGKIIVQTATKGTKFTTLDGVERILHEEDLMICDAEKPMCIAGVFGGSLSGVSEKTTAIFLESAYFDPIAIRKAAKRHGLNTDASFRFERGIDINNVEYCLKRAAVLIKEIAGGEITSPIVDLYPNKKEDFEVFLAFKKIHELIGEEIPQDTIKSILTSLDIKVKNVTEAGMGLSVPSYRVDVYRQVDVIEEILRVYGYNNIAFSGKLNASISKTSQFEDHKIQNVIGDLLVASGYFEILTNSLTAPDYNDLLAGDLKDRKAIKIINPLSGDLSILRTASIFSSLEIAAYNINRKKSSLKLFEFGKTYHSTKKTNVEDKYLSLLLSGTLTEASWVSQTMNAGFFHLKSLVETLLTRLGIENCASKPDETGLFTEGLTLAKGPMELVSFGSVKGSILKAFDIKQEVFFAHFNWDVVLRILNKKKISFQEISKFPEVKRDFALLLDKEITFKQVFDTASKTERKLLTDITLFDVYEGEKLPENKKSYAVGFTLQDPNATLKEKQIEKIMKKLQASFERDLSAVLR